MPGFAANILYLFTEWDFHDRIEAAAGAGFKAVECQFPYDYGPQRIAENLERHGLEMALINLPPGDWERGERRLAGLPGREAEFRHSVDRAAEVAALLGCARVNCMAGVVDNEHGEDYCRRVLSDNLAYVAERLAGQGIKVLLEAINNRDMPGYLVPTVGEARRLVERCGHPNLALQCDVYHIRCSGEAPALTLKNNLDKLGHVQIADHPGRHEPGSGTVDFPGLFRLLDQRGYDGWVGCEYRPAGGTLAGLGWMAEKAR